MLLYTKINFIQTRKKQKKLLKVEDGKALRMITHDGKQMNAWIKLEKIRGHKQTLKTKS